MADTTRQRINNKKQQKSSPRRVSLSTSTPETHTNAYVPSLPLLTRGAREIVVVMIRIVIIMTIVREVMSGAGHAQGYEGGGSRNTGRRGTQGVGLATPPPPGLLATHCWAVMTEIERERETAAPPGATTCCCYCQAAPPHPTPPRPASGRPLTKVLSHGRHFKPKPQVQPDRPPRCRGDRWHSRCSPGQGWRAGRRCEARRSEAGWGGAGRRKGEKGRLAEAGGGVIPSGGRQRNYVIIGRRGGVLRAAGGNTSHA